MAKKKRKKLPPHQGALMRYEKFAEAFVRLDGNQTQAAIESGYSPHRANNRGYQLVRHPIVQKLIAKRKGELAKRYRITTERLIEELAYVAYFDPGECYDEDGKLKPVRQMPERVRRALASIKDGEAKGWGKVEALRLGFNIAPDSPLHEPSTTVNVNQQVQSVAAAQVLAGVSKEDLSTLEIARRLAYVLESGAQEAEALPPSAETP